MSFKYKSIAPLSLLSSVILSSFSSVVLAEEINSSLSKPLTNVTNQASEKESKENIEKISVYGRHNRLILESGTATKSNMTLMQTPAAIVVVDKLLLNEQSSTTLQESLRNISGLSQSGNNYGIGDNLSIRGLGANYTYDGIYGGADLGNNYNPTRSMTNIESVEVLKGPATGLYGIGSAGGVINLIEKKPQEQEAYEIKALVGQWNNAGVTLDATSALTDNTAYRIVANYETSDGYRDLSSERTELYASLRYNISEDNTFLFSAAYIDDSIQIDSVGDPVRILDLDLINIAPADVTASTLANDPSGNGVELTAAQREELASTVSATTGLTPFELGDSGLISPLSTPNEGEELRFKVRQDVNLSENTVFTHQLQYRDYSSEFTRQTGGLNYIYSTRSGVINLDPRAPLVLDDVLYPYAARRQEYRHQVAEEQTWQYFLDLSSSWSAGDFSGEHLLSANYENRDASVQSYSIWDADNAAGNLPYILDIRNPIWPTGSFEDFIDEDSSFRTNYDKDVSAWGISAQEVIYFDDAFTGRFGLAYTSISQDYQHLGSDRTPGIGQELDTDDDGFSFNIGLNYQVSDQFATFINYSKGRTAYSILGSLDTAGDDRPDSESISVDLGLRYTAFEENLLLSFILFETSRTNLRYSNDEFNDDENDPEFNIDVPQYFYDEEDRSRGAELDLNLALNEQWSMNLNATYLDAINIEGDEESVQAKGVPLKFVRLWGSYEHKFNGLHSPVKFSLGMSYEDERSLEAGSFSIPHAFVESYTAWDAAVSYNLESWDIQLNIDNLTDKTYYSKAMFAGGLPAESRNAKLTARYRF